MSLPPDSLRHLDPEIRLVECGLSDIANSVELRAGLPATGRPPGRSLRRGVRALQVHWRGSGRRGQLLHGCAALVAVDLQPGDEALAPALTFCATVNAVIHAGATRVRVDGVPLTMNIDPARVEAAITPRTWALMPVHFAGRACDMDALVDIAARHSRGI